MSIHLPFQTLVQFDTEYHYICICVLHFCKTDMLGSGRHKLKTHKRYWIARFLYWLRLFLVIHLNNIYWLVVVVQSLSHVQLFSTPWGTTRQAPLSTDFPGENTSVGCHVLLQGIFPIQESDPHFLHWQGILYHWDTWEAPFIGYLWQKKKKRGTSLVAQRVKNLHAMWETGLQSLSQEDPLEKGLATHSSNLA